MLLFSLLKVMVLLAGSLKKNTKLERCFSFTWNRETLQVLEGIYDFYRLLGGMV